MKTLLYGALFILLADRGLADPFWPTPIPLSEWYHEQGHARAGSLHETLPTAAPPTVAALPSHYWEDALRHSVYLTLVRDKIDQLISEGGHATPLIKDDLNFYADRDDDEHDLWDKIKTAPFDRLDSNEPASIGEVAIVAKGRLLEKDHRFRFEEDKWSKENCSDDTCLDGVKAFWSVKRVRQRDVETSPGRYHYELTFSVITQPPKKQRKPFESPVRTFTLKESSAEKLDESIKYGNNDYVSNKTPRGEKALWFHKNIVPTTPRYLNRPFGDVDRIFSSLFDDDDERPPRYNYNPYIHSYNSKTGHLGTSSENYQTKYLPYPYKPQTIKHFRSPIPSTPWSHYRVDTDAHQTTEHRYIAPSKSPKIQRPFLPTLPPPSPIPPTRNTSDQILKKVYNIENSSNADDIITYQQNFKQKPISMKGNHFPEHIRPPIFNAPPGMMPSYEKTFKTMPPLKTSSHKSHKSSRPSDFRPSPQVLDHDLSKPDPYFDSVFRPIKLNFRQSTTKAPSDNEESEPTENNTLHNIDSTTTSKKSEYFIEVTPETTVTDIITASSFPIEETFDETMNFANVLSALVKATPTVSQTERIKDISTESSTTPLTSTSVVSTTKKRKITPAPVIKTTTTTSKPTKRTRPPPKFSKPDKVKKHKRFNITTTESPEAKMNKSDLLPAESIFATKNPLSDSKTSTTPSITSKTSLTTSTTSTTEQSTSNVPKTTTTQTTTAKTTTTTVNAPKPTEKLRSKNRFRQSTLLYKGTSVKHDKWSFNPNVTEKSRFIAPSGKFLPRRKGSNFRWNDRSSTTPIADKESEETQDQATPTLPISSDVSVESTTLTQQVISPTLLTSSSNELETNDHHEKIDQHSEDYHSEKDDSQQIEINDEKNPENDNNSYQVLAINSTESSNSYNQEASTEQIISALNITNITPKNNTKCYKKKNQSTTSTTTEESIEINEYDSDEFLPVAKTSTTESNATPDILDDIFGGVTFEDDTSSTKAPPTVRSELKHAQSENHEQYVKLEDSLEDILHSFEQNHHNSEMDKELYDDEDEKANSKDNSYEVEEESSRESSYEDYQERPYNFLELISMD